MKFRKDFVTNSSSSSYVCEICGRTESGWDMGLSEAEMMECVNGHTFCCDEALERPSKKELIKMILENEWNKNAWDYELRESRDYTEEELLVMEEDNLWDNFCVKVDIMKFLNAYVLFASLLSIQSMILVLTY